MYMDRLSLGGEKKKPQKKKGSLWVGIVVEFLMHSSSYITWLIKSLRIGKGKKKKNRNKKGIIPSSVKSLMKIVKGYE